MPSPKSKLKTKSYPIYVTTHSQIWGALTSSRPSNLCKDKENNNRDIAPAWALSPVDFQYPALPPSALQSMSEFNPSRVYPVVDDHEESVDLTPAAYRRSCSIL